MRVRPLGSRNWPGPAGIGAVAARAVRRELSLGVGLLTGGHDAVARLAGAGTDPNRISELDDSWVSAMQAIPAIAIALAGIVPLSLAADAREPRQGARPPSSYSYMPPSPDRAEQAVCEERAQNADPGGRYAGYPCWARETFSRQPR
jgi:hypothetical protein